MSLDKREESIKQIERHIPCGQGFLNVYDISDINSRLKDAYNLPSMDD